MAEPPADFSVPIDFLRRAVYRDDSAYHMPMSQSALAAATSTERAVMVRALVTGDLPRRTALSMADCDTREARRARRRVDLEKQRNAEAQCLRHLADQRSHHFLDLEPNTTDDDNGESSMPGHQETTVRWRATATSIPLRKKKGRVLAPVVVRPRPFFALRPRLANDASVSTSYSTSSLPPPVTSALPPPASSASYDSSAGASSSLDLSVPRQLRRSAQEDAVAADQQQQQQQQQHRTQRDGAQWSKTPHFNFDFNATNNTSLAKNKKKHVENNGLVVDGRTATASTPKNYNSRSTSSANTPPMMETRVSSEPLQGGGGPVVEESFPPPKPFSIATTTTTIVMPTMTQSSSSSSSSSSLTRLLAPAPASTVASGTAGVTVAIPGTPIDTPRAPVALSLSVVDRATRTTLGEASLSLTAPPRLESPLDFGSPKLSLSPRRLSRGIPADLQPPPWE